MKVDEYLLDLGLFGLTFRLGSSLYYYSTKSAKAENVSAQERPLKRE